MDCPICSAKTHLRYSDHPGFMVGQTCDIRECDGCGSSFAVDAVLPPDLYANIYKKADRLKGYDRYARFAREVKTARNPIGWLSEHEDVYFAIASMLRDLRVPKDARILEIGCGLGYLTFALQRAGYSAEGWDVSATAIEDATRRFGPYYALRDANDLNDTLVGAFDVVIFTSFIEHVTDPIAFLRTAKTLLAQNGVIMLTTDNKSFFNPPPVWYTDLPPVHLWWFTENGMQALARRAELSALFFDFADYNVERPWEKIDQLPLNIPLVEPRMDEAGEPIGELAELEKWQLFPLNRSVLTPLTNGLRRVTKPLRQQYPLVTKSPRARRTTMAALLR